MLDSLELEEVIGSLVVLLAFGYAAFWAFSVRRGLAVRLYRRQALGIGLVSITVAWFTFLFDGGGYFLSSAPDLVTDLQFTVFLLSLVPVFYWTDVSLLAVRSSDPLERDLFHWSRARVVLWGTLAVIALTIVAFDTYLGIYPQVLEEVANSSCAFCPPGTPGVVAPILILVVLGVPLVAAALLLPFAARRSKDITLRRHLKWFGMAIVFVVLFFVVVFFLPQANPDSSSNLLAEPVAVLLFAASGYCLYRSARAVTPIYAFPESALVDSAGSDV